MTAKDGFMTGYQGNHERDYGYGGGKGAGVKGFKTKILEKFKR